MEQGSPHAHLRAGSSMVSEASATAAKEAGCIDDQHLSPETQSLLSNSSHTFDVIRYAGQAKDHEHEEDHILSYLVDGSSSDFLDLPPTRNTSAGNATGGFPAAKETAREQESPSSADAPAGIVLILLNHMGDNGIC
jgi:hypothetical protein